MKKYNIYIFFFILILAVAIIAIILDKPSNQYAQFKGNSEYFYVNSHNSEIYFNSTSDTYIDTNYTEFNYVKNIRIEGNINSDDKSINESRSLKIQFNNGNFQLSNVFGNLGFNNLTIRNSFDGVMALRGDLYENSPSILFPKNRDFLLINGAYIDYVMVDDEQFTDFKQIFFEMDNKSYILFSGNINLTSYGINDLIINGEPKKIGITQSEGMLRSDNHQYFIHSADSLEIEISKSKGSVININNIAVEFAGVTNSIKLNDENLILNEFFYWYKTKPEALFSGINAFAVLILVIITGFYARSTHLTLEEQIKNRQKYSIEKKLEKVYSPMDKALTDFELEADHFIELMTYDEDKLSKNIENIFEKMTMNLFEVKKNYGHFIDNEIKIAHSELWRCYISYRGYILSLDDIKILLDLTKILHGHIGEKISDNMRRLKELEEIN